MKKLDRQELKSIKGGVVAPPPGGGGFTMSQAGWEIWGSNCMCDYHYQFPDGSHYWRCHEPCAMICCSSGYGCSLYVSTVN